MQDCISGNQRVRTYGPDPVTLRARFAGQAATAIVLLDNLGIRSVTQSSTTSGLFTVTLAERLAEFSARVWVNGEATRSHECLVTSESFANGTFTFQHYYGADRASFPGTTTAGNVANGSSPLCYFQIEVSGRGTIG